MRNYDYIIVGAGAAGCVLAARLTEQAFIRVLLLEAGIERHSPLLSIPLGEVLLMGKPSYDWCFRTEADPTINGRSVYIPRGRLLGGSNAINGMIFVRGQPEDYDEWANSGNPGWSWANVLPYFQRLERTYEFDGESRGRDGPISVGLPRTRDKLCDAFLTAAAEAGYPSNPDYNSGHQEGFGYYQVTHNSGRRSSAVATYLKAARQRPNLTVITDALVTGVNFKNRRCVSVCYRRRGVDHIVDCGREVALCAGVVQSPQLLELSGIGSAEVLRNAGIPVLHHLPGVGENFRDHFATRMKWRVRLPITFNERTRGLALVREIAHYAVTQRGVLSLPIALGFGFLRSSFREPRPDLQFHFAPASYGPTSTRRLDSKPGMTLGIYPMRPESQGTIHIRSADPFAPPAISPRFLAEHSDCLRLIAGMRIARHIVESTALNAYRDHELSPGVEMASDDELLAYARANGDTSYHPVGTCRMGNDPMAVVDHRLRVHGIYGLRVIDASVMPTMVSGNTNAATLMIAEKGAAMIREDCGLPQGNLPAHTTSVAEGARVVKSVIRGFGIWRSRFSTNTILRRQRVTARSVVIESCDPQETSVAALLHSAEAYAHSLYPAEGVHMLPAAELSSASVRFLVARDHTTGVALGCGALVLLCDSCAELKRMFVATDARRRGVGSAILRALEHIARSEGIRTVLLETGPRQADAIALYHRFGYSERGPFGKYQADAFSIFMEKTLR